MATGPKKVIVHGRTRWMLDLRRFGGGRPVFRTQTAAKTFLASTLEDQAAHGRLAFDLPPETRRRYLALDTRAVGLGTTLEAALDWWVKSHRTMEDKPLSEAVEACMVAKREAGRRHRYLTQLEMTLRSFCAQTGPSLPCSDVTVDHIEAWLRARPLRAETRRGYISRVSALFGFCLKRGWAVANPALRLEEIRTDRKRPGILTIEQTWKLLHVCRDRDPRLLPFFALSLFAGLRFSEVKQVTWATVDMGTGYIEVASDISKTRERRLVKLHPNAIEWLRLGGDLPPVNLEERFDRVRRAAGWAVKVEDKGMRWPHNAMRHSFCSYCLPVFGELQESAWAGHSPQIALSRYRELVTREDAERFWRIMPK